MNTENKPKRHIGLILFILVLLLAAAGGGTWYFYQREMPRKTVESFLQSMQKTDFHSMEKLLQSSDLSALDDADVRNDAYVDFFKGLNEKMSWEISRTKFDFQNGTAEVTAHIRYIDGSDIYRETISEFLRQIVSTALSGETITEEETQAKLAVILNEKSASTEDKFCETDLTYPLIKTGSDWKIVALDENTVTVMSANFKNVEAEINQALEPSDEAAENSESESTSSEDASAVSNEDAFHLENKKFSIRYTKHQTAKDFSEKPCLLVYYDYTNNSDAPSSAMVDVNLHAYQNGELCAPAIPEKNNKSIDNFMAEVQPGETVTVCQAFSLSGKGEVQIQVSEAFTFTGDTKSQTLKLK